MPRAPVLVDPELGELTDDRLTRDVRVFQRAKGHRFSADDVATAFVAHRAAPGANSVLDLGCGLGSVLLHLAWSLPTARMVGVEAQAISYALLARNVARSGYGAQISIHHGDLRDEQTIAALGHDFDLVTGTPPYFPPRAALDAEDAQRAYARIEYRGGVEEYVATGARLLAKTGVLVLCGDARAEARVALAATRAALRVAARLAVVPRAGRPPLFAVWTLAFASEGASFAETTLTLRDESGERTADAAELRAFSGFAGGEAQAKGSADQTGLSAHGNWTKRSDRSFVAASAAPRRSGRPKISSIVFNVEEWV